MVAAGQRRQETCATPTAACHNVAAEPFRFETVSTIKEINYFRYNVNECERGCGARANVLTLPPGRVVWGTGSKLPESRATENALQICYN